MKTLTWKRILVLALAVFLLVNIIFSDFVFAQSEVQAEKGIASSEEIYVGDFNLFTYRADVYLKNDTVCNRIIKYMANDAIFPSQKITEYLGDKFWFQAGVEGWEKVHWAVSPSEILQGAVDQKGYYTAIILSVFKAEMKSNIFNSNIVNEVESAVNKYMSNLKKWVEESDTIGRLPISKNQILTTIPVEQQKMIQENLAKEFKKNHPILDNSNTIVEGLSVIFDAVKTLGDAIQLMESYICLTEISENMKAVLTEMYNQCPIENVYMKSALLESASAAKNLKAALDSVITNVMEKGLASGLGTLIDEGWKKLIESNPYAAAFKVGADVGAWLGDTICNTLFSTDKTVEQYEKMKCLDEFTVLLRDVSKKMGSAYLSNKSTELAENYFASVEVLFSAANLSCKFAEDYGKILYEDSSLGWITISGANYQSYMDSVKAIKCDYEDQKQNLYNCYLAELEEDYPDIYAILMGLNAPDPIPVTGIAFDHDTEKIWLEMLLLPSVKKPVIYPENATNKKITYTSSDPTILDVNEKSGEYYVKQAGTVTITATSEDGGFTDAVTVEVMEGKDSAWGEVSLPGVVHKGKCGENVYWVLYENGKLVISGEGEISAYNEFYGECLAPWYFRRDRIKSVIIENGVSSIGSMAFEDCFNLKEIELPSSVTSINWKAFWKCTSLDNIKLPLGLNYIGGYAFEKCTSLSSIEVPSSVTYIGEGVFEGCTSLSSIEVPSSVTYIGDRAFWGCTSLSSIEVPSSVTYIGDRAFWGCTSLSSIEVPSSVTYIGDRAFWGCTSLSSIELSSSVTSIGECAFFGCSSLTSIEIPSSVTEIGYYVFSSCKNLASITIENSELELKDSGLGFYYEDGEDKKIPNFTIYGISGSKAEKYAEDNGFTFLPIPDDTPSKADLSKATVTLKKTSYTYDGKAKTPAVTVKNGEKTLSLGVDYSVTYQNNTNAGTAKAQITGKGNYTGILTREFTIQKAAQALSCTQMYNKAYGNKPFAIKVSRKSGTGSLSYTTSDKKVADVKNGKVTIKGTGVAVITIKAAANANYNAKSIKSTIKVSPQKQAIKSLKPIKGKKLTVAWKKDTRATGYQIQYSTDKNLKKSVLTVTVSKNKTVSKTIPKLAKGKRYYVRVCSYKTVKLNGKSQKLLGAWSTIKRSGNIPK